MFFKIDSWNFQYLSEIGFHECPQNFNLFSSFRQLLFSFFLPVVWLSWNFVRFLVIPFHLIFKVSAFYLEKQKSFISKKHFFWPLSIPKQKCFVYWLNFLEGVEQTDNKKLLDCPGPKNVFLCFPLHFFFLTQPTCFVY